MKTICKKPYTFIFPFVFGLIFSLSSLAQPYPLVLSPSGTTTNFMKFVPKQFTYNGTNYATGYLALTAYQNITTQAFSDPGIPLQKIQLQGEIFYFVVLRQHLMDRTLTQPRVMEPYYSAMWLLPPATSFMANGALNMMTNIVQAD